MATIPAHLQRGDTIRVIGPSRSLAIIPPQLRETSNERLKAMEMNLTFGKYVEDRSHFRSTSIKSRTEDLHTAFGVPAIKAVITIIAGVDFGHTN